MTARVRVLWTALGGAWALGALGQTTCPPGMARPRPKPPPGIAVEYGGPEIDEVVLKGIVRTAKGYTAMLEDCRYGEGKSFNVQAGYRLWNGRVSAIDADGITFEYEPDAKAPAGKPKTRRLVLKPPQG
jgi:hypothetical protein